MKLMVRTIISLGFLCGSLFGQTPTSADFRTVVEKVLKEKFVNASLSTVCPLDEPDSARVFADYGAIFVAKGVKLPSKCILDEETVESFQSRVTASETNIGGVKVTLQSAAMAAFLAARQEAAKTGLSITPRGGSSASTRSYDTTVKLWESRFLPALSHWTKKGKISVQAANAARVAPLHEQVSMVLDWEKKGIYFSKNLSKSILYSVAVPGASQHIFMVALDVKQFANKRVRQILASHGWFQTVKSDQPHFTYLGRTEDELPSLGLVPVIFDGQTYWIPNVTEE